ncbi:hypothetical protein CEK28_10355 [Xenophilus sp. AP218F]|nr:hypothetical protein CEK28_10355 [Xenophilus sp. AP218F]
MTELTVDRMTLDARLPRADNALIDRLQRALSRWSDESRLRAPDNLAARVLPALTLDLGRIPEADLERELTARLDRALAAALAGLTPPLDERGRRAEIARWLQHGTPLWTQPSLSATALGALLYSELRRGDGAAWLTPLLSRQAARLRLLRLPAPLVEAILDWLEQALPVAKPDGNADNAAARLARPAAGADEAGAESQTARRGPASGAGDAAPDAARQSEAETACGLTSDSTPAGAAAEDLAPSAATDTGQAAGQTASRAARPQAAGEAESDAERPSTPAQRLARLLNVWDDAQPLSGRERGYWRRLLKDIEHGLAAGPGGDDAWLEWLTAEVARRGAPPGLAPLLDALLEHSRLPLRPGTLRARRRVQALRGGEISDGAADLAGRLLHALGKTPRLVPLLDALRAAEAELPPARLNAALRLWLANAWRILQPEARAWPQSDAEAAARLRQTLREDARQAALPALLAALEARIAEARAADSDERALCDLIELPRLLASPALPARLAEQLERFLAASAPGLRWRRKLNRQLRLWSEGRAAPQDYAWEQEARERLAAWASRLAPLAASPVQIAALRACRAPGDAHRQALAARLLALEKLLPPLLGAHPELAAAPHWQQQLKRLRLKLWRGAAAPWQPLAEALAAQCADAQGLPGLWPDALTLDEDTLAQRLEAAREPALAQAWQAARALSRPLRGDERRQWREAADALRQLLDGQSLDQDSRFWCDDAGLVLLWPFLPEWFRRAGWLDDDGHWLDEACQLKAWRALAGLIGRAEDHEQGHTARLLAGLEIDEPLADAPEMSAAESAACSDACAAFEQAWAAAMPAMPLASGISQLFLRRQGVWRISQAGWQLSVEGQSQDILLARLPWSLGLAMLPWREDLLTINWQRPALPAAEENPHAPD